MAALLIAGLDGGVAAGESSREAAARLYRESLAAYRAEDYAGFLAATKAALVQDPESPRFLYNLACGQALTGEGAAAVGTLERLAGMGLAFDLDGEADLASVRGTPAYANAVESMRALERPVGTAERAFTLNDSQFIPEGIARDPADGSFYLGSVRKRAIVRIGQDGRTERAVGPEAGLDAVLGMAVDARRRVLWVCTSALPEMEGFREEDAGRAALVRFELSGARPRAAGRFELPPAGEGDPADDRVCNDLAVGPGGEVYVADSAGGGLFRLPAGGAALEPVVPAGTLRSPNGLVVAADGRRLYVADYAQGLFAVDPASGTATPVAHPADLVLRGIDGLAAVSAEAGRPGALVAIQNGVRPHRVVRLDLAAPTSGGGAGGEVDGTPAVLRGTVLLRAHPDFDEPTLGLVAPSSAGNDRPSLYLVANSHWGRFAADHSLPPPEELTPPVVLELPLPPVGPLARRGFLGVAVAAAEDGAGLNVTRVIPRSTAAAVGFETGDRILAIDGREVGTAAEFVAQVGGRRAGERVAFRFRRGETVEDRTAELTPFPAEEVPGSRVSYEQVTVDGGARLRTVVTRPAMGAGPFPALFLLDGLSCSTIDLPFAGDDDAFVRLVHAVAGAGYATMRLERSGVGDSEGRSCSEVDFGAELASYRAGLAALRRDPSIDPARIFVFGISMGGVMAPLLDAGRGEGPPLAGIAVYGTILKSFFEYLVENRRRQLPRDGLDPVAGEEAVRRHNDFMARFILDGLTPGEVAARYPDLAGALEGAVDDTHFFRRPAAFFHQLQRRHLAAAWASVGAAGTRVLALHGEYDWVSARDDHEAIAALTGGRFVELPGLDHGITAHPSLEASYENYTRGEPSGAVAEALVAWLGETADRLAVGG